MLLSTDHRRLLHTLAEARPLIPSIYYLASLYRRFGYAQAREVSDIIAEATLNPGAEGALAGMHFRGLTLGANTSGFRAALADPSASNPQTGHFFSYVAWALEDLSLVEYAAAIGHELFPDRLDPLHTVQLRLGLPHAATLQAIVGRQSHDPEGTIDYAALDAELASHGWSASTLDPWNSPHYGAEFSLEEGFHHVDHTGDPDHYTGNSIQDLRCTVVGFVMGRIIKSGAFGTAAGVAGWMERNVLDSTLDAAGVQATPLSSPAA
jgi:hypothetical protein